jgi:hypothetical protein
MPSPPIRRARSEDIFRRGARRAEEDGGAGAGRGGATREGAVRVCGEWRRLGRAEVYRRLRRKWGGGARCIDADLFFQPFLFLFLFRILSTASNLNFN